MKDVIIPIVVLVAIAEALFYWFFGVFLWPL